MMPYAPPEAAESPLPAAAQNAAPSESAPAPLARARIWMVDDDAPA